MTEQIPRSLAPPANFSVNRPPGVDFPSASLRNVPGLSLTTPSGIDGGLGASGSAFLAQLEGGLVRNVAGWPSQEIISQPHIVKPWQNGYHERITRGQVLFYRRESANGQVESIITLPQINAVLKKGYHIAKSKGILERSMLDQDTWSDVKFAIAEDLEDELDRKRRLLNENVQDSAKETNMIDRIKNSNSKFHVTNESYRDLIFAESNTQFLRYLSVGGIVETWNYIGVARNIEHSHTQFKVLNCVKGGPLNVDNYWGESLQQGQYTYLILTRKYNRHTNEYEEFQYVPWAQPLSDGGRLQTKYPDASDLYFEDESGYGQTGVVYTVGKVGRVVAGGLGTNEKSMQLAGLMGSNDPEMDAWRETSRDKKGMVFLTIGRDAWDKAGF